MFLKSRKQQQQRRKHRRVPSTFRVHFRRTIQHQWEEVTAIDVSGGGCCLLLPGYIDGEGLVHFDLGDAGVQARVKPMWHGRTKHNGKPMVKAGFKFIAIASDHWDTIRRFVESDEVNTKNLAAEQIQDRHTSRRDMGRLFPSEVLVQITELLVKKHRLAPPKNGTEPLLHFRYLGPVTKSGVQIHRVTVYSRITRDHEKVDFTSRFEINGGSGEVKMVA